MLRPETEALLFRIRTENAERGRRKREAFFASGDEIPDLDLWPSCPVCDVGQMDYDEHWWCVDCGIEWDRDGVNGAFGDTDDYPQGTDG